MKVISIITIIIAIISIICGALIFLGGGAGAAQWLDSIVEVVVMGICVFLANNIKNQQ